MLGIKKKAQGIKLIEEVAGRFTTMIEELERGADDCQHECAGIQTQIQMLNQRDTELCSSITQAQKLASNLRNLIG
jgi:hypothetical protein